MVPCKGGFDNSPLPFHTLIGTILIFLLCFSYDCYIFPYFDSYFPSVFFCAIVLLCYFAIFHVLTVQGLSGDSLC